MKICNLCEEQKSKGRHADPHKYLKTVGEQKEFRGSMTGGYEEQGYECTSCGANFTYSNDKNDYGWIFGNS